MYEFQAVRSDPDLLRRALLYLRLSGQVRHKSRQCPVESGLACETYWG